MLTFRDFSHERKKQYNTKARERAVRYGADWKSFLKLLVF